MKLYGLLGRTLTHSFSQRYFTQKFFSEGIAGCEYRNFELGSIAQLPPLLEKYPQLQGLNVTIPYKEAVLPYLHYQNAVVQKTGACNCIKIVDGRLFGFNTDVVGFQKSLEPHLRLHHRHALILGTGGAAKAVEYVLNKLGIHFQVVSRHPSALAIGYEAIDAALLQTHLVIINTTPVGMYPHTAEVPQLPYHCLTPKHLLFDLIYNPETTLFLQKGQERGAQTSNGYSMLLLQAEESWRIWNSNEPE